MIINAKIESDDNNGEIIIKKSQSISFQSAVTTELQTYFNNSNLIFNISESDSVLFEEQKFTTSTPEETEDALVIILSIIIVCIGAMVSLSAFLFNKWPATKADNTKFITPLFIALAIYDLISDINLSTQMFQHEKVETSFKILFYIGIIKYCIYYFTIYIKFMVRNVY